MKTTTKTPTLTIEENANVTAILSFFFGGFLLLGILCLFNPFFTNIFNFATIIITLFIVGACLSASNDRERGVKRVKPTQKTFFPKGTAHVFFITMIVISAGLELCYYLIAGCWFVNWLSFYSTKHHVRATYIEETDE